ncbi:Rieske 2Fe-2S domain-containing protein [Microbispora sp. NPDC049633]|uniref:Rieske 2Fe-2S domain-containing protein n=1 Tax=Microbispora sp. NPDC049633 TaxID=3154355 RepID=UPI003423899A
MSVAVHTGWYLLAFEEELAEGLTPLRLGGRRLLAVRDEAGVRVFDGLCPHRGAALGHGGKLDGDCVICPFHGKRVALGDTARRWSVAEYAVERAGAAVFVRLSADDDRGFQRTIKEVADGNLVVGAVIQPVAVPSEYVVENAFDAEHFHQVHLVPRVIGMRVAPGPDGELAIEGEFRTKAPPWERERRLDFASRFYARAFSPSLVVTELGTADAPYTIITGAVPTSEGCVGRVAIALPPERAEALDALVHGARYAFEQDRVVWDHLDPGAPQRYDAGDRPVLAFRRFCATFGAVAPPGASATTGTGGAA